MLLTEKDICVICEKILIEMDTIYLQCHTCDTFICGKCFLARRKEENTACPKCGNQYDTQFNNNEINTHHAENHDHYAKYDQSHQHGHYHDDEHDHTH